MKIHHNVVIDAAQAFVWTVFNDPDSRRDWQRSAARTETVSGKRGTIGHVLRIHGDPSGDPTLETVTELRAPDFVAVIAESTGACALTVDRFETVGDTTRWSRWSNVTFRGLRKLSAMFRTGAIHADMVNDMERFKLLAESRYAEQPR